MIASLQISAQTPIFITPKEIELLLCCARTHISTETAAKIRELLKAEIDWNYLLKIATWHKVQPLLYWSLKNTCPDEVPQNILNNLYIDWQKSTFNNLFLSNKLINILHLLESNDIPVIPFKGPVLATSAYGNLSLRKFGDLDILVKKHDIPKVTELLISEKYQQEEYLTGTRDDLQQVFCEYSFLSNDGNVCIDLHWELTPTYFPFKPDFNSLWKRLQPVSLAGTKILELSPEDTVLYLCVHGCKDLWQRLSWICDIAQLIQANPQIQWLTILEQAKKQDCERMLLLGLSLAQDIQALNLPEEIEQAIHKTPIINSLATEVRERLFSQIDESPDVFERSFWSWRLTFHFRIMENFRQRVLLCLFILRFALTPKDKDYVLLPLPSWLSGLYYLVRPVRLLGIFGLTPLKRFREWCISTLGDRNSA